MHTDCIGDRCCRGSARLKGMCRGRRGVKKPFQSIAVLFADMMSIYKATACLASPSALQAVQVVALDASTLQ